MLSVLPSLTSNQGTWSGPAAASQSEGNETLRERQFVAEISRPVALSYNERFCPRPVKIRLMMRLLVLLFLLAIVLPAASGEEFDDIDMQMIVELADGVWKGNVISVQEIRFEDGDGNPLPYRNAEVLVETSDGGLRTFRASKIGGDWRLDEAEIERLELVQNLRSKTREVDKNDLE